MVRKDLIDSGAVRGVADLRGRVYAETVPGSVLGYVLDRTCTRRVCAPTS